ncbi:pentatricopeptide repeat-containing protein At1g11900 isoform X1 [Phalaenopsis equestris]|uniref:pentatricopeptide repeat-containing protein At1g11900 isoform X1 n=1 Tax=Phalaenopsis equestris TaxID=78828 RepID=UPI0009E552E0|nr:pentatricopeptide repeat-containing protein At1g11900 isoform X1 [Phalaenopsis equestris]
MYRYRLMPLLTMNLSRLSFRLLLDGYACSGCHRCSRVFFSEAGHLKPGADGDSEYCEHNYSGCLGFRHGRSKSMIGNSFPAKLMSSLSSKQSELASEVGHYRKISTAISVTDESLTKALQLFFSNEKDEVCYRKDMCSILIEKLCKVGNLSDAVSLLQHSNDKQLHPNLNAYNSLLAEAAETSDFDLFCDIFQKLLISKLPPDLISYLNVARVLPSLSDSKLLKFIKEVSENTVHSDPTVVNRIIFLTAKSGQINKSVMIFEELKNHGCKIDTVTFNTVLAILGRAGQVYKMLSEFSLMKELGYSPDTVTYDTLINCLRRLGRLDLCKAFAKEMIDVGFELDLQAYTALIDGLGRAGHVNDAMILFGEMKKRHCPSIYVYRAMISNLRKFGKIEAAMDLWKEMNSSGLKLVGPEDFRKKKCRVVE